MKRTIVLLSIGLALTLPSVGDASECAGLIGGTGAGQCVEIDSCTASETCAGGSKGVYLDPDDEAAGTGGKVAIGLPANDGPPIGNFQIYTSGNAARQFMHTAASGRTTTDGLMIEFADASGTLIRNFEAGADSPFWIRTEDGELRLVNNNGYLEVTLAGNVDVQNGLTIGGAVTCTGCIDTTDVATDTLTLGDIADTAVASGTYTPTLTHVANVAASTAFQLTYQRIGNTVAVYGRVNVDPTSGSTLTQLGMTLPVASNFTNTLQLGGTGSNHLVIGGIDVAIYADDTNNRATLEWTNTDVALRTISFSFGYEVL